MNELLGGLDLDEPDDTGARPKNQTNRVEQAILVMANAVWAVIGLFLWIPQIVRVVITSAFRLVHAALTRQSTDGIRGPIRQVSHFYVDGFLSPGRPRAPGGYGSRELQLGRFLTEALWVAVVWLAALRLVSPQAFTTAWQGLTRLASWLWGWSVAAAQTIAEHLPGSIQFFANLGSGPSIAIAVVLIVFLAAGFILGRRSR